MSPYLLYVRLRVHVTDDVEIHENKAMSKVSKISNTPKGCNAMYVKDVEDMQIHLRVVMLCMLKMKEHTEHSTFLIGII